MRAAGARAGGLCKALGRGLWHFVVGDSPEFLVAVMVLVGFALGLHAAHVAVWVGLPVLVVGVLAASVWRRQRVGRAPGAERR